MEHLPLLQSKTSPMSGGPPAAGSFSRLESEVDSQYGSPVKSIDIKAEPDYIDPEAADLGGRRASVPASIYNLTNTIIGAGILTIPYGFSLIGYALGIGLLIFTVGMADYSIKLLLKSSEATYSKTYEGVAHTAFGNVGLGIVSICVLLLNIGSGTAYMIILGDVLPDLIADVAGADFLADDWERAWCTGMVTMVFLIPLTLLRSISALKFTSFMSLACVLLFTIAMVALVALGREETDLPTKETVTPAQLDINVFRVFSIFAFAFTCHSNVFPIYLELKSPTPKRMMGVVHSSMVFCFVMYMAVGISGYFDYVDTVEGVQGDVLVNLANRNNNIVVDLVRLAFALSIIATFPLCLPPVRQAIAGLFFEREHPTVWPLSRHLAVTFSFVGLTFIFGLYVPVLEFVFGLAGATAGVTVVYVMPPLMNIKVSSEPFTWCSRWLDVFMAVLGVFLGGCSTVVIILDFIED